VPDYLVIKGYDDAGYYYTGYKDGGPTPWETLGTHDVQSLEVYSLEPCPPAPPAKAVKDALTAALRTADEPAEFIFPDYRSGPAGFELWAAALEAGQALYDGEVYNAQVWGECRALAVEFLREARDRLAPAAGSPLAAALDEAEAAYTVVRDRLVALLALHPERPRGQQDWKSTLTSPAGAALMRQAAEAERRGVAALRGIVAAA